MSTDEEMMWKVMNQRSDDLADRWYKPAGIGLLVGIIGTAIAVSNHPTPTWAVAVAAVGGLVCLGSFAIPMSTVYKEGNRLEQHVNSMADYPEDFDDDEDFDEDEDYPHAVEPVSAPAQPAPPAGGSLLSSLRQQPQ